MRILLDENFPADFAALLVGHEASNVHSHGWAGIKNGELLRRAHGVCEVFVTLDRNTFPPYFWWPTKSARDGGCVAPGSSGRLLRVCSRFGSFRLQPVSLDRPTGVLG